ncbi:helix-turn-helix transcriptional regulator [Azospirillum sp. ST 5-10]|uniref:helix-turn-helix transcriptional regulator n=1 Tax=unclassified Azospirillum TaxID=2630922 RepID=UPI003F4A22EB
MTHQQPHPPGGTAAGTDGSDHLQTCVTATAARCSIASGAYRGECGHVALRTGLRMHYCDGVDLIDLTSEGEMLPGLVVYFFLKGVPEAHVGGRPLMPGGAGGDGRAQALMMNRTRPELLERHGRRGNHVRKVTVAMTQDWLADAGLELRGGDLDIDRFTRHHLTRRDWSPTPRLAALAEQLLRITPYTDPCRKLFLESRVLDLVAETFADLSAGAPPAERRRVRALDRQRMRRIEEALAEEDRSAVCLDRLARDAGVSVSTLQRLFHAVHGVSAFEFIRRRSLERARTALDHQGLSVKEAAFLAGYSDPGNFSKAYLRYFGRTPGRPG